MFTILICKDQYESTLPIGKAAVIIHSTDFYVTFKGSSAYF